MVLDDACQRQVHAPRKTLSIKQLAEQVAAAAPASVPDTEAPDAGPPLQPASGAGPAVAASQAEGLRPGTPPQARTVSEIQVQQYAKCPAAAHLGSQDPEIPPHTPLSFENTSDVLSSLVSPEGYCS